ncbi:MAG: hypothetical protein IJZ75_06905 [Clostridia bacterium]|nr:hypothetical protein [Clostridia bacterium]
MIKKRLLPCLLIILIFLTGCTGYTESDSRYIVSALGFERTGDGFVIYAQTVTANEGKGEIAQNSYRAFGESLWGTLSELKARLSKPISFEHCSIIAISPEIPKEDLVKICDFCKDLERLNTSVYFAVCEDIEGLLGSDAISESAGGYDISSLIESRAEQTGINYKNRLYEILSARENFLPTFNLPIVSSSTDEFYIEGEYIYTDFTPVKKLDNEQSVIYSLITNQNSGGYITVDDNEALMNSSHTYLSADFKDERLYITLEMQTDLKQENAEFCENLYLIAQKLLSEKTDIFGFANVLEQKHSRVFEQIKGDYGKAFENCVIELANALAKGKRG